MADRPDNNDSYDKNQLFAIKTACNNQMAIDMGLTMLQVNRRKHRLPRLGVLASVPMYQWTSTQQPLTYCSMIAFPWHKGSHPNFLRQYCSSRATATIDLMHE
jgi:hypothetical protein